MPRCQHRLHNQQLINMLHVDNEFRHILTAPGIFKSLLINNNTYYHMARALSTKSIIYKALLDALAHR